jgi:hypothetical protein
MLMTVSSVLCVHVKINERKRAHVDEMTLMREKYEQLETQVQEYHHRLIKAMRG